MVKAGFKVILMARSDPTGLPAIPVRPRIDGGGASIELGDLTFDKACQRGIGAMTGRLGARDDRSRYVGKPIPVEMGTDFRRDVFRALCMA